MGPIRVDVWERILYADGDVCCEETVWKVYKAPCEEITSGNIYQTDSDLNKRLDRNRA